MVLERFFFSFFFFMTGHTGQGRCVGPVKRKKKRKGNCVLVANLNRDQSLRDTQFLFLSLQWTHTHMIVNLCVSGPLWGRERRKRAQSRDWMLRIARFLTQAWVPWNGAVISIQFLAHSRLETYKSTHFVRSAFRPPDSPRLAAGVRYLYVSENGQAAKWRWSHRPCCQSILWGKKEMCAA